MQRVKVLSKHVLEAHGCAAADAAQLEQKRAELEKQLREINAQLGSAGDASKGPLAGIKIIDCCQAITGPFGAMMLADMGADVIKVESPGGPGDMNRGVGPLPPNGGEYASYFHNHNRGKRCIALDMKKPEGLAAMKDLAKTADIFIQNMRPGVAGKLGFGYDALKEVNDDLIYVSISGYGQTGPYRDRPAFDAVLQCMTGFPVMQGQEGEPQLMNTFICDKITSYTVTQAVLAALHARNTGKCTGQNIELSMLDCSLMFFWLEAMSFSGASYVGNPKTTGMQKTRRAPQQIRKTKDGYAAMQIWPEASHWNLTLNAFGLTQDWLQDASTEEGLNKIRKGYGQFQTLLNERFAAMTNKEVDAIFDKHQLPGATVVDIDNLHEHPQAIHMKSIVEHEVGKLGMLREPRPAPLMSKTPLHVGGPAPNRGQHTVEVLKEIGYSEAQINAMRDQKVFGKFG